LALILLTWIVWWSVRAETHARSSKAPINCTGGIRARAHIHVKLRTLLRLLRVNLELRAGKYDFTIRIFIKLMQDVDLSPMSREHSFVEKWSVRTVFAASN
jgi:hypothetical protein